MSPRRPPGPCAQQGCPHRATHNGRCVEHAVLQTQYTRPDRGTTTEQGYGWEWQKLREAYLRDNTHCVVCLAEGKLTAARVVDHIVPLRQGGSNDVSNLQALCDQCHNKKRQREGR